MPNLLYSLNKTLANSWASLSAKYSRNRLYLQYSEDYITEKMQRRCVKILLNLTEKIQEINYSGILQSATSRAFRVFLLFPRVENTIDPAITDVNFPRLANTCTDATYQRRLFYTAALLWIINDINDVFPISRSAAKKMPVQTVLPGKFGGTKRCFEVSQTPIMAVQPRKTPQEDSLNMSLNTLQPLD